MAVCFAYFCVDPSSLKDDDEAEVRACELALAHGLDDPWINRLLTHFGLDCYSADELQEIINDAQVS